MNWWMLAVSLCCALGPASQAFTQRPTVQVRIELPATHPYGRGFDDNQRAAIESQTADRVTTALNSKLSYLDFGRDTSKSTFTFHFGDRMPVPDPNTIREVGFWLAVDERVTRAEHQIFIPFRVAADYRKTLPPTVDGMVSAFSVLIENYINRQETKVVRVLSRTVSVADSARRLDAPHWALPFTHAELNIGNNSEFRIAAEGVFQPKVRSQFALYAIANGFYVSHDEKDEKEKEWDKRVVALTQRSEPQQPDPLQPERFNLLSAKQIYVTRYSRPPSKEVQ